MRLLQFGADESTSSTEATFVKVIRAELNKGQDGEVRLEDS